MRFVFKTDYAQDIALARHEGHRFWYPLLVVLLVAAPWLLSEYGLAQLTFVLIYAIVGLGLMPVGAAFYVWDHGVKHGDIRVLGAASYATPLLSTAFLIVAGFAQATTTLALAALLIAGGGLLAAKEMMGGARRG